MPRKLMPVQGKPGRSIRVPLGAITKERIIDPTGVLAYSRSSLSPESQKAFSEWKKQVQSGEIQQIKYP